MKKTDNKLKIADFHQFFQREDHMIRGVGNFAISPIRDV